jgi:tetratricopeptide (TPR) repeat protein
VAVTICAYAGATSRYLLDFIPALALLAGIGVVGLHGGAARQHFTGYRVVPLLRVVAVAAFAYSVAVGWLLAVALSAFYRGAENSLSLLNSGRIPEGVAACEKVCRINPDFRGTAELGIGSALLSSGRAKEAVGYLQSAVLDGPRTEAASFNLGRAYLETGSFREAAQALSRAAALDPLDAGAEALLGIACARQGRLEAAVDHLKAALRLDPSMDQVRGDLRALEIMLEERRKP